MSTKMDEDDWKHTLAVFRACLPRRGRKGARRPPLPRGASFLHRRERSLARAAGALRSLEQRVEALRSVEQGWRLRGLLRHARVDELHGASPSDVRLHRRARSCVGGRSKGGQEGQALGRSRGGFTTKIHAKSDASGDIIAFDLTGGEAFDGRLLRNPARHRARHRAPRRHLRQRLRQQGQSGRRESARHRSGHPPQGERKEQAGPSSHAPSTRPAHASSRASDGSKRFKRVALRCEKTERNFRSIVSFAAGLCLIKFVHTA